MNMLGEFSAGFAWYTAICICEIAWISHQPRTHPHMCVGGMEPGAFSSVKAVIDSCWQHTDFLFIRGFAGWKLGGLHIHVGYIALSSRHVCMHYTY